MAEPRKAVAPGNGNGKGDKAPTFNIDLQFWEQDRTRWFVGVPAGFSPEDLQASAIWAVASQHLKVYDEVTAVCRDRSWIAGYLVCDKGAGWASVMLLWHRPLPARAMHDAEGLPEDAEFVRSEPGERDGWKVRIKGGYPGAGTIIAGYAMPCPTKEDARREAVDHARYRKPQSVLYTPR